MNRTMYKISVMAFLGITVLGYAQVGVNTEEPKATLDIRPKSANAEESATTNEGIIAPKLSKTRIANIANPQEGTLVYATDATYTAGTDTTKDNRVAKITEKGYYYYNGTEWVKSGSDENFKNIYTTNGTLSENRIVNNDGKKLTFKDGSVRVGMLDLLPNESSSAKFGVASDIYSVNNVQTAFFVAPNIEEGKATHIQIGKKLSRHNSGSVDFIYNGEGSTLNGIGLNTFGRSGGTGGSLILFARADGNVGIGTNSPTHRLEVNGGNALFTNPTSSTIVSLEAGAEKYAYIQFKRNATRRWDIGIENTAEADGNVGGDFFLNSFSDTGEYLGRRFTISRATGNLRLGSGVPTEKLDVDGNIKSTALAGTGNRNVYADKDGVLRVSNTPLTASVWKKEGNLITLTEELTSGNTVSIDQNGQLLASSFKGKNGATIFPDYVFQKYYTGTSSIKADYNFKTLSQVEDFVKANGHLPGYQSAEAIKAQGYVDLMATQLTNVEKIEELYLHLMEKEKEVQNLKNKNEELELRLERLEQLLK